MSPEDTIDGMAAELVAMRALVHEGEARLVRDAVAFREDATVQRLGFDAAKACAATCSGRATLVRVVAGSRENWLDLRRS